MNFNLRLLGAPSVRAGRHWTALPTSRPTALLVYLAERDDWAPRAALRSLFWPDADEVGAQANLRQVLARLRSHPVLLEAASGGLNLDVEGPSVRLRAESDLRQFRDATRRQDWARAVRLYDGEFALGLEARDAPGFGEWLERTRARFRADYCDASLNLAAAMSAQGRPTRAASILEAALDADDLAEEVMAAFLRVSHAAGRRDEAARRYAKFERDLHSLGLQPLAATVLAAGWLQGANLAGASLLPPGRGQALTSEPPPEMTQAAQARQVLVQGQEAAKARQVLVQGQEAAQAHEAPIQGQEAAEAAEARKAPLYGQEAREVLPYGQEAAQARQAPFQGQEAAQARQAPFQNQEARQAPFQNQEAREPVPVGGRIPLAARAENLAPGVDAALASPPGWVDRASLAVLVAKRPGLLRTSAFWPVGGAQPVVTSTPAPADPAASAAERRRVDRRRPASLWGLANPPGARGAPNLTLSPPPGREREASAFEAAWRSGRVIVLTGDAGIGKTRFLAQVSAALPGRVSRHCARPGDRDVPFSTLMRIARDCLTPDLTPLPDWVAAHLTRLLPELNAASQEATLLATFEAVTRLILLSSQNYAAISLEALHHADDASLDAMAFFIHRALERPVAPLRVVITMRRRARGHPLSAWLAREAACIHLEALDPAGIAELLAAQGFGNPGLAGSLWRFTGGSPAFVQQTLAALAADGRLEQSLRTGELPRGFTPAVETRAAILDTLQNLSPLAVKLTRLRAVLGRKFNPTLARRVLGEAMLELAEAFEELETQHVLRGNRFTSEAVELVAQETVTAAYRALIEERLSAQPDAARGGRRDGDHHDADAR